MKDNTELLCIFSLISDRCPSFLTIMYKSATSIHGNGKRRKSVLNLRMAIIFFSSIQIKAKSSLGILGIEPGTIILLDQLFHQ